MVKAEVDYDGQHGPIVRVQVDDETVAVYLAQQTGVLTTERGQAGIEVTGPWHKFKCGIAAGIIGKCQNCGHEHEVPVK